MCKDKESNSSSVKQLTRERKINFNVDRVSFRKNCFSAFPNLSESTTEKDSLGELILSFCLNCEMVFVSGLFLKGGDDGGEASFSEKDVHRVSTFECRFTENDMELLLFGKSRPGNCFPVVNGQGIILGANRAELSSRKRIQMFDSIRQIYVCICFLWRKQDFFIEGKLDSS